MFLESFLMIKCHLYCLKTGTKGYQLFNRKNNLTKIMNYQREFQLSNFTRYILFQASFSIRFSLSSLYLALNQKRISPIEFQKIV